MVEQEKYSEIIHLIGARKYLRAAELIQAILKTEPKNVGLLLDLAYCYTNAEKFDKAVETYKKVIAEFPSNETGYVGLGFAYEHQGMSDEALKEFETSLKYAPDNALVHFEMGQIYFDQDEYQIAIDCFKKAIQFGGKENDGMALDGIARCNLSLEKYSEAIENAQKILEVDPSMRVNAYNLLAIGYLMTKDYVKAKQNCEAYIKLNPSDTDMKELLEDINDAIEGEKESKKKPAETPAGKKSKPKSK